MLRKNTKLKAMELRKTLGIRDGACFGVTNEANLRPMPKIFQKPTLVNKKEDIMALTLKAGDKCIVVAIGEDDAWFDHRDSIIGKEVVFKGHDSTLDDGFISCAIEPLFLPDGREANYFCRIKLEKVSK